ncbi:MAG TPA: ferric reductase-like transmembrane domain-containing protein [Chloroflexia bacterium]|nr:ferric reductase-like transmembrane domain-containing protein [Chloroflexia bacterium]
MLRIQTDTPTAPKGYNLNSPAMDQATGVSQHALQAEITALQATNRPKLKLILLAELLCIVVGGGLAWLLTPWLQTLAPLIDRQFGAVPEVFRDVSRASGLAAYGLLWVSMVFGVLISGRMSRVWPGGPEAFELHRFCSVLALGFTLLHVLVLLGDPRLGGNPVSLLAIGALSARAPWAWLGQLALYALAIVIVSFYVRRWIGRKTWRLLHTATFLLYFTALVHSIGATTDSSSPLLAWFYIGTTAALAMLTLYRLVTVVIAKRKRRKKAALAAQP